VHPAEAQHDAALELGDDPNARPEQEQNHGPDRDQYEHRVHIVLRLMPALLVAALRWPSIWGCSV
jgi:hypothetical protein